MQQLERLVEAGGVGATGGADRVDPLQVAGQRLAGDELLAGPHPVAVAHDRVDLAVVGDEPVGVGERPGRERVGREARVHERQRRLHPLVGHVGEELAQLRRGEHALVDERAGAEAREVHAVGQTVLVRDHDVTLDALAGAVGATVEVDAGERPTVRGGAGHEQLPEARHHGPGHRADRGGVGRHVAPPEGRQALLGHDGLDLGGGEVGQRGVGRQERQADGVGAGRGEREVDDGAQEPVGDLQQHAGPVTGVGLGALGAAVVEVAEGGEAQLHDAVGSPAVQVDDEGHAAGVVLVRGVVEALRAGKVLHEVSGCFRGEREDPCRSGPGRHWPCRSLPSVPSAATGGLFQSRSAGCRGDWSSEHAER